MNRSTMLPKKALGNDANVVACQALCIITDEKEIIMPKKKDLSIPENLKEEFTKTAISNLSFSLLQRDDEALDDLGTLLGVLYEPDLSDQERNLSSRIDRLSKTMKT